MRRAAVLLGWFGGLAALLALLHASGGGDLAGPPLLEPRTWGDWAGGRAPAVAAMAVVRLTAFGVVSYLLAATVLGLVAQLAGGARTLDLVELVSVPLVRRVVQAGLGAGLTGSLMAAAAAATSPPPRLPTAADVALAAEAPAPQPEPAVPEVAAPPPAAAAAAPPAAGPVPRTWVIQRGQHLWSVASTVLAEAMGREPGDREVAIYWRALIERNRHLLPDPDLVHVGLTIELPDPVPSRG